LVLCQLGIGAVEPGQAATIHRHKIPTAPGRAAAVTEALRILRPGGQLILVDFRHADCFSASAPAG
jgi:hypothetical protein